MRLAVLLLAGGAMLAAGSAESAAQNYFGAIAYDAQARYHGYSYDYRSQGAAEQAALGHCAKGGSNCTIATWFRNACGALAVGDAGWGADWGLDQSQAEGKALQKCYEYTVGCKIQRWVCTTR
jgi:serine/threonine-protein kinase